MRFEKIKEQIRCRIGNLPVIDAHDHLIPESEHLTTEFNFSHLLEPYIWTDLHSVGMPSAWRRRPATTSEEIAKYWQTIGPLWGEVKHGSYAKVMYKVLREFFGIESISDDNYIEIGKRINQANTPGIYKQILQDKCNIKWVLNQNQSGYYDCGNSFIRGGVQTLPFLTTDRIKEFLKSNPDACIDDYCEYVCEQIAKAKGEGAILVKFCVSYAFYARPDRNRAAEEFKCLKNEIGTDSCYYINPYVADRLLSYLPETGLIACVHTGVWDDITQRNPELLYPVVKKHSEVIFDVYHMGIPYVEQCGFLGKNFQNVYLNLCWAHIVAPSLVVRALRNYLDYVPMSKIFGFGGDYLYIPQNVWAHLEIAKDNFAEVFAHAVCQESFDVDEAVNIIGKWLYFNPKKVYGLI